MVQIVAVPVVDYVVWTAAGALTDGTPRSIPAMTALNPMYFFMVILPLTFFPSKLALSLTSWDLQTKSVYRLRAGRNTLAICNSYKRISSRRYLRLSSRR